MSLRILSDTSSDEEFISQKMEKNLDERRKKTEALKKHSDQKTLQMGLAKKNQRNLLPSAKKSSVSFCT